MKTEEMLRLVKVVQRNPNGEEATLALERLAEALHAQVITEAARGAGKRSELAAARSLLLYSATDRAPLAWEENGRQYLTDFAAIVAVNYPLGLVQGHNNEDGEHLKRRVKGYIERCAAHLASAREVELDAQAIIYAKKMGTAESRGIQPVQIGQHRYNARILTDIITLLGANIEAWEQAWVKEKYDALYMRSPRGEAMLTRLKEE